MPSYSGWQALVASGSPQFLLVAPNMTTMSVLVGNVCIFRAVTDARLMTGKGVGRLVGYSQTMGEQPGRQAADKRGRLVLIAASGVITVISRRIPVSGIIGRKSPFTSVGLDAYSTLPHCHSKLQA
jgi:hypothetical protein